jgi:ABC-type ATPase involved in cell division
VAQISNLYLENFRSFITPTWIRFRPITLLYGQNSAGKSSILKALLMMQQTFVSSARGNRRSSGFVFSGDSVDLGSFITTISNHQLHRTLRVGVQFEDISATPPMNFRAFQAIWGLSELRGTQDLSLTTKFDDRQLLFRRNPNSPRWTLENESIPPWLELVEQGQTLFDYDNNMADDLRADLGLVAGFLGNHFPRRLAEQLMAPNIRRGGRVGQVATDSEADAEFLGDDPTQPHRFPNPLVDSWDRIYRAIWPTLNQEFHRLVHVGPLRREPPRIERYVPTEDREVGRSGEHMLALLHEQPRLVTEVNNVLASMELPYRIKVVLMSSKEAVGTVIHLVLTNVGSSLEVSPSDVGVGYSQVLPLIAQSVLAKDQLVCVEQPELHLHPAMQARLADMFLDQATGGNRARFLIETHSESLMLRFLRRIREERVSPDEIQVLYVDQDHDGNSVVTELPISSDGEFMTRWPNGFFDERLEELGF